MKKYIYIFIALAFCFTSCDKKERPLGSCADTAAVFADNMYV